MTIGDPRCWPCAEATAADAALHALAAQSLAAGTAQESEGLDAEISRRLADSIAMRDGGALAHVFESAPSAAVYRHLWRALVRIEAMQTTAMTATLFAIPLIVVAGAERDDAAPATIAGVLSNVDDVSALLRRHGALAGNQTFALANALVAPAAIDIARIPSLLSARTFEDTSHAAVAVPPASIRIDVGDERVHLRFIVGIAVAATDVDLTRDSSVSAWGMPLTQALSHSLAPNGIALLVLPRAPKRLSVALQHGRSAQREVSAQLFASNALRRMRASIGEPVAVISAHRANDAPAGGELRASLSSALDPADAEGFRCPLYRTDRPSDVAEMLVALLRDCGVADVRVLSGVHRDRDPVTGMPFFYRADALPESIDERPIQ